MKVHFTCKLEDGTIFDTSSGKEPLQFTIGKGEVMEGFEKAVIGMNQGETKTAIIGPEKAFGPHLQEKVNIIGRDQFPPNIQPIVGMKFEITREDGKTNTVRITEVSESTVTLDTNHPLAGKDLVFDLELVEIQEGKEHLANENYQTGIDLQDKGQLEEAISYYQKAIELNPNFSEAFYNLGVIFQKKEMTDKAILHYEIAIGLNQTFIEANHNLGIAYKEKGLFDEAIICFQRVLQLKQDHAGAYYNLGNTLVAKGLFNEALQCYQKAVEIKPDYADAHWGIGLIHLRLGNFEEGWKGYEWRWALKDVMARRDFSQPQWDSSDIQGHTILLHAEQGFGDTIQFIRYAPMVAQRGARIIVECQKELTALLKNIGGVQHIIAYGDPLPAFDVHCPLLSLPFIFATTIETIPAKIPYISADPMLVKHWRDEIASNHSPVKIGLIWAGDSKFKYGHDRSCTLDIFSPLANFNHVAFYSLQKGEAASQAKNPPEGMKIVDYSDRIKDFSDTAAIMENLDLIISVDTAVAHLAGALGKQVWTLLPFVSDWRWMLNREDSPWYPSMRLFRQPSRGDWESVTDMVKEALKNFLNS